VFEPFCNPEQGQQVGVSLMIVLKKNPRS